MDLGKEYMIGDIIPAGTYYARYLNREYVCVEKFLTDFKISDNYYRRIELLNFDIPSCPPPKKKKKRELVIDAYYMVEFDNECVDGVIRQYRGPDKIMLNTKGDDGMYPHEYKSIGKRIEFIKD